MTEDVVKVGVTPTDEDHHAIECNHCGPVEVCHQQWTPIIVAAHLASHGLDPDTITETDAP